MASAPPPPQPPQPSQQTQPPPDAGGSSLSWEGDKMFNIYIYDYCHKRGFKKTAKELLLEADIAPESTPPINARQGLLFEWWSVFWVLFQAKSNPLGGATDDALTYTQHQTRQAAMRMQSTQSTAPGANGPPLHIGPQAGMPPRMMNGMPQRPASFINGSLPNGVGVPPGAPGPGPFSQPNGTSNPGNSPHAPHGAANPPPQGPSFMSGGNIPRPPLTGPPPPGQVQQVRTAPTGPFQSPQMAHSPPGSGAPQQQSSQFVPVGASPHLPNMGRAMVPQSPMNPNPQAGTPQPGQQPGQASNFNMGGRPPSRTTTPAGIQPSPSLAQRQINGDLINMEILQIPNAALEQLKLEFGLAGKEISALTTNDKQRMLSVWKSRRPSMSKPGEMSTPGSMMRPGLQPQTMQNRNKRNSNSPGDEHESLPRTESSPPERKRQRVSPGQTPSMAPMPYPGQQQQQPSGSSGMPPPGMQPGGGLPMPGSMQGTNPGMSGPMPPGHLGVPPGMQGHGSGGLQGQNMMPGGPIPQGGPGPSGMPPGAPGMPQGGPNSGPGPGMQPMGGGPPGGGVMMMQGRTMPNGGPHPGQMGMPPQMGGTMSAMSPPQMGPPGMTNVTMYRQNMHNIHKNNMPVSAPSPASTDPSFSSGGPGPQFNPPNTRPGTNPAAPGGPPQNRMPPPPSPAPGKDGSSKDGKPTDGSPRNQQTPNPSTPAPNQQNPPSNHGTPVGGRRAAPSPVPGGVMGSLSSIGGPGSMNQSQGNMNMAMMGMPPNMNQPPPTATMSSGAGSGGNNTGSGGGPGGGAGGPGGPGGGGIGIGGSGMHFLAGMNPMVGMNAGTGLGMNMNMGGMNQPGGGAGGGAGAGAGGTTNTMGGMGDLNTVFSQEFMQGVANALDDIDPSLFRPDGDLNFERDFGQWFNHPDDPLDLK